MLERNSAVLVAGALATAQKVKEAYDIANDVLPESVKDNIWKVGSKAWKKFWGEERTPNPNNKPKNPPKVVYVKRDPLERASNALFMKHFNPKQAAPPTPSAAAPLLITARGENPAPLRARRPHTGPYTHTARKRKTYRTAFAHRKLAKIQKYLLDNRWTHRKHTVKTQHKTGTWLKTETI